ncbi:inositol-3-phosphate synthase [Streptomyces sp. CB01881]|uniref:inositol-3-phosphate synthase n=1 Tax=Streptomyces sp. CB01881 TaxID=2078691 RepID=UPI000CDCBB35|nr:inositol-3-phosphate synthase [Streptomyces sp. CB01881]AUY50414.1 myo-inositol-1-phosphate synthase [Streptomyces sp. CB01881]TYC73801.1 myo-inositol-1-phosphate synthase [Streptomyces sp. CB01881]
MSAYADEGSERTGVWLVGARGSVATTTVVGALAIRAGLADTTGMVTALEPFAACGLPAVGDLVFGGHDVTQTPWAKKAEELAAGGVLPARLVDAVGTELAAAEGELRAAPASGHPGLDAEQVIADLMSFRERNGLARVVVVHVASTEAAAAPHEAHANENALAEALAAGEPVLPPSSVYAWAAMQAGCGYIDFTPSTGARLPALDQAARRRGVPYAGQDGKTGETLVKSVLAPMMAQRNLRVTSWSSVNLLGGGDGATLAEPAANASKTASKARVLEATLGYVPEGPVRIDEVRELGDAKVAWDLMTFDGFLGARMRLDFTWQGIDSALAAPLVLDLARLVARAHEAGRCGELEDLAFFFKDPAAGVPHDLASQWKRLCAFADDLATIPVLAA